MIKIKANKKTLVNFLLEKENQEGFDSLKEFIKDLEELTNILNKIIENYCSDDNGRYYDDKLEKILNEFYSSGNVYYCINRKIIPEIKNLHDSINKNLANQETCLFERCSKCGKKLSGYLVSDNGEKLCSKCHEDFFYSNAKYIQDEQIIF